MAVEESENHPGIENEPLVALVVDQALCVGVGQCELLEPDVFRLDDDSGLAQVIGGSSLPLSRADTAIDRCPSGAIAKHGF